MKREICFALIAYTREDELSKRIDMPLMRQAWVNAEPKDFLGFFKDFIEQCQGREGEIAAMLKNLGIAINKEHAMDLEMKRLEAGQFNPLDHEGMK